MRRLSIFVLAAAAVAIAAPVATADQPTITPAPAEDLVDTTSCSFPVAVHYTVNGETAKTFSSGKTLITGALVAQYSANGKSVTLNISGPATITPSGDTVSFIGRGVGAGPLLTPDGLILGYFAGPVVSEGTPYPVVGKQGHLLLNVCDALAP